MGLPVRVLFDNIDESNIFQKLGEKEEFESKVVQLLRMVGEIIKTGNQGVPINTVGGSIRDLMNRRLVLMTTREETLIYQMNDQFYATMKDKYAEKLGWTPNDTLDDLGVKLKDNLQELKQLIE